MLSTDTTPFTVQPYQTVYSILHQPNYHSLPALRFLVVITFDLLDYKMKIKHFCTGIIVVMFLLYWSYFASVRSDTLSQPEETIPIPTFGPTKVMTKERAKETHEVQPWTKPMEDMKQLTGPKETKMHCDHKLWSSVCYTRYSAIDNQGR